MSAEGRLAAGATVGGRYRLEELLGRGGMGTVWRAADLEQAARGVALKIVTPRGDDGKPGEAAAGRFLREFRAMDRLRSPHVAQVFDHASDGALIYISMELLTGETLRDHLKGHGKLDAPSTLHVFHHVGRAIALAHQRGIVHRDLKPGNIFLCDQDNDEAPLCKVLDFGMAKSLATPLATLDAVQTEAGRPLGTPYYMSPEQARGKKNVDHRSDLWAIGVLVYECLCGERPFKGRSLAEVFAAIAAGALPVPSHTGEVPAGFDAWFERAVQRDVQERFQSAKVMLEELAEVLGEATTIKHVGGGLGATMSDVAETQAQYPSFGGRTIRRAPPPGGSSFVGRDDELRRLRHAMQSHCRVLTVTGPAGSGRRRLLHELAAREASLFPGGAWTCSLANATDAESLWVELAIALGVRLFDHDAPERIGRSLSALGKILVVMEEVEGVRALLSPALIGWLSAAPDAVFAVTAKRALEVPTESVLALSGLAAPAQADTIEHLGAHPATELFLRRGISFRRQLLAAEEEASFVAKICRRVFGHPLAIEVLAAMVEQLTTPQIALGMERTLTQPGGTAIIHPDALVVGALHWVWAQLDVIERSALTQCAVFRGGFTLEAAEAVVNLDVWPEAPPVADMLDRFVAHGLLHRGPGAFGEGRFELPVPVREICSQRVQTGRGLVTDDTGGGLQAAQALTDRHTRYYAQLGSEEALEALEVRGGVLRRARYALEWNNVRAATESAAERTDGESLALLSLAAAAIHGMYGSHAAAARALLRGVVAEGASERTRLLCLIAQGVALHAAGRLDAANEVLRRADDKCRELGEVRRLAECRRRLASVCLDNGEIDAARAHCQQATLWAEQRGDRLGRAEALRGLAAASAPVQATQWIQEALTVEQQLGARRLEAESHLQLGTLHADQGQRPQAFAALDSALAIYRELGERFDEARVVGRLGALAAVDGRIEHGMAQLEQAVGLSRELGARTLEGELYGVIAELYARQGKLARAWPAITEGEQLLRREAAYPLARLLCRRAHIEHASGQTSKARTTLGEVEAMTSQLSAGAAARLAGVLTRVRKVLG